VTVIEMRPSQRMSVIGIVQDADPILRQIAAPFDLPRDADEAGRVVADLQAAMVRAARIQRVATGMGVSAPQLGIGRAAAVVRAPGGDPLTLLNPRIVVRSDRTDEQYEGCWSFFDVRGKVPRPLSLDVEYSDLDGGRHVLRVENALARLVAHEVDHLLGVLYVDRMQPGNRVVQVSGQDVAWGYAPA
jgi:peptide deformylase